MQRRGTMHTQRLKMIGGGVAFVASQTILRVDGVPLFHARIAMGLREDGRRRDGYASSIAFDEGFLFDQNVELHGVQEKVIRRDGELLERGGHGLAAGLVNVPGIDALRINFGDGPGEGVLADARSEFGAAIGGEFFRVVKTNDAALWIENHGSSNDGTEQRASAGFIQAGNAHPTEFPRLSLETGRTKAAHLPGDFSTRQGFFSS